MPGHQKSYVARAWPAAALPVALLWMVSSPAPARAEEEPVSVHGEYRAWLTGVSGFTVDPAGAVEWAPGATVLERLRIRGEGEAGPVAVFLEGDLFYGTLYGDRPAPGSGATAFPPAGVTGAESFVPREGCVEITTPVALIRAGHQLSQWGLGILANSGQERPMEMFSQRTEGDIVERLLLATKPLAPFLDGPVGENLLLATGADLVYRDENADLLDDDRAWQYLGTILYKSQDLDLGAYVVYRDQADAGGTSLDVLAVDAAMRLEGAAWQGARFKVAAEVAWLSGRTDRTEPWNSPTGADVNALGAAVEAGLGLEPPALSFDLTAGYAAGDSDFDDAAISRFRFDPDYNVGLILFDHYLYGHTAAAIDRARQEEKAAEHPIGLEQAVTRGAVENAVWVAPAVTFGRESGFAAALQALFAWTAAPAASPYETFEAGGAPTAWRGARTAAGDLLGIELDLALRYRTPVCGPFGLELRGEGGTLFPGAVFENAEGEAADEVWLGQVRAAVTW